MIDLQQIGAELHETAKEKGFWPEVDDRTPDTYVAKLMMVTTEVAEIVEAYRKQEGNIRIEEEFADLIIRILDLYAGMAEQWIVVNALESVIESKADINLSRPRLHGNLI